MQAKQHRRRHFPFTVQEAQVFRDLFDLRIGLAGPAARDYVNRYIRRMAQAFKLKKKGMKVRISMPDFPGRPMLIIEK